MDRKEFKAQYWVQNTSTESETDEEEFCIKYLESLAGGDLRPVVFENYLKEFNKSTILKFLTKFC